jgi:predicted P-loop ATPase/GTPase
MNWMKSIPILKSILRSVIQFVKPEHVYLFARQMFTANRKEMSWLIMQAVWSVVLAELLALQMHFHGNIQTGDLV